ERAHVSGIEAADAADAKALRHRELARVDDEAALLQQGIKTLEDEACVPRHVECHDDRALQALWEQRLETERAHAINQHPAVLLVAPGAAGLTAFGPEVDERLTKRRDHMGWRGEAVLLAGKEGLPLREEVEHERRGIALSLFERLPTADDECQPRHPLEALVGGGGKPIKRGLGRVERQGAKCAHGIDEQPSPLARN